MTEEEKKRRGEELKRRRQAENKAKGAHKTSARPDAPRATTGQEDTNTALEAAAQGGKLPETADAPKTAGNTGTSTKAAGIAANGEKETQTTEQYGPQPPEGLRHDPEMDEQFVDSLIQARLQGPQAFAAWVDTLPLPGSGAKETDGQTWNPPGASEQAPTNSGTSTEDAGVLPKAADIADAKAEEAGQTENLPDADPAAVSTGTSTVDAGGQAAGSAAAEEEGQEGQTAEPLGAQTEEAKDGEKEVYGPPKPLFLEAKRTYTDEEALVLFKQGRMDELPEEQQAWVRQQAEAHPDLFSRSLEYIEMANRTIDLQGKDTRAATLGEQAAELLQFADNPYLTGQERGELLIHMMEDQEATKAGGYDQMDAYYAANPDALKRYDGYIQSAAERKANEEAANAEQREYQDALLDGMIQTAMVREMMGRTTGEDEQLLSYLDEMDVFADGETFFIDLYGDIDKRLAYELDSAFFNADAYSALKRDKQYAMALGMTLEELWTKFPERAHTAEDYVSYAKAKYEGQWVLPMTEAIAEHATGDRGDSIARWFLGDDVVDAAKENEGIGMWGAAGLGIKAGAMNVASDVVNTGYGLLNTSSRKVKQMNCTSYIRRYGVDARAQLRTDLLKIANHQDDEAEKERMLALIENTPDIFDVPINVNGFLNVLKNTGHNLSAGSEEVGKYLNRNGKPNEILMYQFSGGVTENLPSLAVATAIALSGGGATLGVVAGYGIPAYGGQYRSVYDETGDHDLANSIALTRTAVMVATERIPFDNYYKLMQSGAGLGLGWLAKTKGARGLRGFYRTVGAIPGAIGKSLITEVPQEMLEELGGGTLEQLIRYGRIEDLAAIWDEMVVSGKGAVLVAPTLGLLAGGIGEFSTTLRTELGKGEAIHPSVVSEGLAKILADPQMKAEAQAQYTSYLVEARASELTTQMIAGDGLETKAVAEARKLADARGQSLQATEQKYMDLEQQQQAALTQLSEAGTQLMNAEGEAVDGIIAQIETLMDPVDTLTADLQATRDKLQEDRALYGEAQSALDNELGSALDHIRANSYEKAYEEITALQEEGGKLTDEREAPAEVEAAGTAEENVSEETGDLQETEEENGSIMNMVNGEKMFENDSPSQGIYDPERDVIRYPDEDVPHSLGARSWNDMDILVPWSNSTAKLAPGTRLQNVETFAGKGTRVKIRDTQRLEETYNIPADKWEKTKGFGTVIFEGEEYEAEIHWYQYKDEYGINREEAKVKSMDTEEIW